MRSAGIPTCAHAVGQTLIFGTSRGEALAFRERVVHGSGGNASDRWRRAYVLAFRTPEAVAAERAMGFTHSHEDDLEVLRGVNGMRPRDGA